MDFQPLFNVLGAIVSAGLGWFAKELWNAVGELKRDLAKLREELPKEYVPKNDFKDAIMELKALLITINAKIDHKVDK